MNPLRGAIAAQYPSFHLAVAMCCQILCRKWKVESPELSVHSEDALEFESR